MGKNNTTEFNSILLEKAKNIHSGFSHIHADSAVAEVFREFAADAHADEQAAPSSKKGSFLDWLLG